MKPSPFGPRFPVGMQVGMVSRPGFQVQSVQPLGSTSPATITAPTAALAERLATARASTDLTTAEASAIIALPVTVGFGVFAVVASFADPVMAALWSVTMGLITVAIMRHGDANHAMKALAAWLANVAKNDAKADDDAA
jgi:hypothetical protein